MTLISSSSSATSFTTSVTRRLPLRFEANVGQFASDVLFSTRGRDATVFLTSADAAFCISRSVSKSDGQRSDMQAPDQPQTLAYESATVRLKPVNANPETRIVGLDPLPGRTNYLIGNDPTKWRTNIVGYARVKYEEIYPGIDLIYYENNSGRLEYDFIVHPGADASRIAISIEGADKIEIDSTGDLLISAATGSLLQPAPRIYQEINGNREEIIGSYKLVETEKQIIAFDLAKYDESKSLIIDPEVIYATYLGGSSNDIGDGANAVAVDAQGAAYIAGAMVSADFTTMSPLQGSLLGEVDAFITKLDSNGQLVYSTFLGGNGSDTAAAIKVDETGAVYLGGNTGSTDFPRVNALQPNIRGGGSDAFIAKLNAMGSGLEYSTYLGGSSFDVINDIALDDQNNLFALGSISLYSGISDFPTVNPSQATYGGGVRDGFWSMISANGSSLLSSTYLGGDEDDFCQKIDVDLTSGSVFVSLFTNSSPFLPADSLASVQPSAGTPRKETIRYARVRDVPVEFDVFDRFTQEIESPSPDKGLMVKLGNAIGLVKAVRGLLDADVRRGPSGQSVTTSQTGGGLDARVTLFDEDFDVTNTLFFGGSREETVSALAIDDRGGIYIAGSTTSTDLPTVNPIQANHGGGFSRDGFLAVFHPQTLTPVFATYLGGSGLPDEVKDVTVDAQGNIYVVGFTSSTDFPSATPGAIGNQLRGRSDAFILKISPVEFPTVPDFELSFDTPELTVSRGSKVPLTIKVNRIGGFTGEVTVSKPTTLPKQVKVKPANRSTTGNEVTFKTLKVGGSAPVGQHELEFTGRDQSNRTRTVKLKLVIQ